uniref:Uncharacterized protein n=1 Tax=Arundo donax TaxID=35708 RepID=A0A0A9AYA6_ARUDO
MNGSVSEAASMETGAVGKAAAASFGNVPEGGKLPSYRPVTC